MANQVHLGEFISRLIAPIAAKQGAQSRLKVRNEKPLTDVKAVAKKIYERHTTLTDILIRLGVSEETAAQDACKMEHDISDETFEALKKHAHMK